MRVVKFDDSLVDGLVDKFGMSEIWLEITDDGEVNREIGFFSDRIVHLYPGTGKFGRYGVFDKGLVTASGCSEVTLSKFDDVWKTVT